MRKVENFSLLWLYLANSQVSVYRTIGPLVINLGQQTVVKQHWWRGCWRNTKTVAKCVKMISVW